MGAQIIDGKAVAAALREKIAAEVCRLATEQGLVPGLAVVLVGDNPVSAAYVRSKSKHAVATGLRSFDHHLPGSISPPELLAAIGRLNADPAVHGILVQLPLPPQIDAEMPRAPQVARRFVAPAPLDAVLH